MSVIPSEPELSSATSTTTGEISPYIINLPNSSASSPAMMSNSVSSTIANNNHAPLSHNHHHQLMTSLTSTTIVNLNLSKEQQKQLLNAVRLNDSSSLLKELLKYRHTQSSASDISPLDSQQLAVVTPHQHHHHHHSSSLKNKFNCYSSRSADLDEEDEDDEATALSLSSRDNKSHVVTALLNNKSNHTAQNGYFLLLLIYNNSVL